MSKTAKYLRDKMRSDNKRFWAGDNVSEYIEHHKEDLINETTEAFE